MVAAAEVGSLALGGGDRWSDLDLTFGIAEGVSIEEVLDDFSERVVREFAAARLFDLPFGSSLYRVFLLPGCLQVDLSVTPAAEFGAHSPKFRLVFGEAVEKPYPPDPDPHELFGWAVHDAVRARFSLERGKLWLAEFHIGELRNYALSLACLRRGLPAKYGRGLDQLPEDALTGFEETLARAMKPAELLRALRAGVEVLLRESSDLGEVVESVEPRLREVISG